MMEGSSKAPGYGRGASPMHDKWDDVERAIKALEAFVSEDRDDLVYRALVENLRRKWELVRPGSA